MIRVHLLLILESFTHEMIQRWLLQYVQAWRATLDCWHSAKWEIEASKTCRNDLKAGATQLQQETSADVCTT